MKIVVVVLLFLALMIGLQIMVLYSHIGTYQKYWQQRAAEPVSPSTLTYVALGDSAAQGIGASRPQKSYVGLLAEALQKKTSRKVHVINLGVSGAKVSDVTKIQIPKLEKLPLPKDAIITLEIGSNDMSTFDAKRFNQEMAELLSKVPTQTVVADIPYFGGGRGFAREPKVVKANATIIDLTRRNNLKLVALHQATKNQRSFSDFAIDFFHPSDQAYEKWFNAFWEVLK